ncbi:unnamed protein product, partial [Alternaria alternata]
SQERLEEAIGTLCGYSFVSRREGDNTSKVDGEEWYDLHRLVHLATRVWVDKHGSTADVVQQAVAHIAEVFPSDDFANQAVWRAYMPHSDYFIQKHLLMLKAEQAEFLGGTIPRFRR